MRSNLTAPVSGVPAGAFFPFPKSVPVGYLPCNGAAVSRTDYADLFAYLGTSEGAGDGVNTFNLPDYRGEFIRGNDDGRGVDSGRVLGSVQLDNFKSHGHSASSNNAGYHGHSASSGAAGAHGHAFDNAFGDGTSGISTGNNAGTDLSAPIKATGNHTHSVSIAGNGTHSHTVTVNANGGNETRPRNVTVKYGIKF